MGLLGKSVFAGVILLGGLWPALGAAQTATDEDRVVEEMCGKSVAMLGESPTHGFGKTMQFKVALVQRLVNECDFNAFFIESGVYDFLKIEERLNSGEPVTEAMIAAAIGGVWANKDVQPIVPFLTERVKAGSVTVDGLDDQIGWGSYASAGMAADLVAPLAGQDKVRCLDILERHLQWQYSDAAPYREADKERILGCLTKVEAADGTAPFREDRSVMVASLRRLLARDFRQETLQGADLILRDTNERDRSMYLNFETLLARLPAHSKVIVWAATVHVAKDLSGVSGDEKRVPLGKYVRKEFGDKAFALGFSAASGEYAMGTQPVKALTAAPADSLEEEAFAGNDLQTAYLPLAELRRRGAVLGRALGTGFKPVHWGRCGGWDGGVPGGAGAGAGGGRS